MALKSSAWRAASTLFKIGTLSGSPPVMTYVTVGEVTSISSGPSQSVTQNDVTTMDSEAHEYVGGLVDNGTVTLDMNYVPTDSTGIGALHTALEASTQLNGQIAFSDSGSYNRAFKCNVENMNVTIGNADNTLKVSVTLRISGKITDTV